MEGKLLRLINHADEELIVWEENNQVIALMSVHFIPQLALEGDFAKISYLHTVADKKSYILPLIRESSGTKRYFGLGAPLYQLIHENHFLCIDELETSLHPELMKHFLQIFLINTENSQLLITTHNLG